MSLFFKQRCINDLNLEGMDQYVVVMPASAVFDNYDSTQPATQNAELIWRKAELIRQNIRFRNTKCIQSDRSILGLSIQGLVSHIIRWNIAIILNYCPALRVLAQKSLRKQLSDAALSTSPT